MSSKEPSIEAMTVGAAWAAYDLAEQEYWDEYAADPSYLLGRCYIVSEWRARRRCERLVERIRYRDQ